MITMLTLGEYGRLGNQLFQYAMLKSVSCKLNYELKIPDISKKNFHEQNCLLSNFKLTSQFLTSQDNSKIINNFKEKNSTDFDPAVFNISDNTNFFGIYINKNYFIDQADIIKKEYEFIPSLFDYASDYLSNLKRLVGKKEIVSVHIRRGYNTDKTNPALINYYGSDDIFSEASIFGSYFNKAKKLFSNKEVIYLIFTGGSRNITGQDCKDIEWCKKNIYGDNVFYSENNSSIQDFAIMSMCDHNIIAHETTFSWWAAFLNKNSNKIVVAPDKWFFSEESRNRTDFYPEEFFCI